MSDLQKPRHISTLPFASYGHLRSLVRDPQYRTSPRPIEEPSARRVRQNCVLTVMVDPSVREVVEATAEQEHSTISAAKPGSKRARPVSRSIIRGCGKATPLTAKVVSSRMVPPTSRYCAPTRFFQLGLFHCDDPIKVRFLTNRDTF